MFKNKKALLGIPNESGVKITDDTKVTVYKCYVTDFHEKANLDDEMSEFVAYSIGQKLQSGMHYKVTYMLIPHPLQGSAIRMVIFNVEKSEDSISKFKVNENTKQLLDKFKVNDITDLDDHINYIVERMKGLTNADFDNKLLKIIDFWYHTPFTI